MITLQVSGKFLERFFQEGTLYEPILVKVGLPPGAVFIGARMHATDLNLILVDFQADGPDREIAATLVNVAGLEQANVRSQ